MPQPIQFIMNTKLNAPSTGKQGGKTDENPFLKILKNVTRQEPEWHPKREQVSVPSLSQLGRFIQFLQKSADELSASSSAGKAIKSDLNALATSLKTVMQLGEGKGETNERVQDLLQKVSKILKRLSTENPEITKKMNQEWETLTGMAPWFGGQPPVLLNGAALKGPQEASGKPVTSKQLVSNQNTEAMLKQPSAPIEKTSEKSMPKHETFHRETRPITSQGQAGSHERDPQSDLAGKRAPVTFINGPMNKIHQFVIHQNNAPPVAAQISDGVQEALARGVLKPLSNGQLQLTIQLRPANLGSVQVVLVHGDQGLTALLSAPNAQAHELLHAQLGELKQSLAACGITVHKVDITPLHDPAQTMPKQDGQAFQHQQSHTHHRDEQRESFANDEETLQDLDMSFEEWLTEGEG
ncbi:flagellar hook-length control protein FliK [Camelliibacillus cellulosilyticus]|uniref:Flagellar hook-length control protein FliK n=1 Tax=Camelliibacillus cellulosilyticus TaxID=2174486 RepID=A0ABV9GJD7_9BACL